jgi:hypothetical protein
MRRISAILVLLLYLSVNIDLREVMRVPFLFEHYNEHRQQNAKPDFLTFILLHYFTGNTDDADVRHSQLPFKASHDDIMTLSVAIPTESICALPDLYLYAIVKRLLYKSPLNCTFAQFNIWQPPKA